MSFGRVFFGGDGARLKNNTWLLEEFFESVLEAGFNFLGSFDRGQKFTCAPEPIKITKNNRAKYLNEEYRYYANLDRKEASRRLVLTSQIYRTREDILFDAIQYDPMNSVARNNLAVVYFNTKRPLQDIARLFDVAIELDGENYCAQLNRLHIQEYIENPFLEDHLSDTANYQTIRENALREITRGGLIIPRRWLLTDPVDF